MTYCLPLIITPAIFNGAVLIAEGDSVLYERGFGEADMAFNVPNTPDTKFRIASTTKQFTAALIHLLAEEGRLDLEAPITNYLTQYPSSQGDRVTALHLLTHTSGIPNYTSLSTWDDIMRDPYAPDSFLSVFAGLDLEFEPGSQFNYSNSNYFVLGVLIEHLTGQSYADALRERLLDPLGLYDSGYDTGTQIVEQKAKGYVRNGEEYAPERYIDVSLPYAAGMMYSTVRDLHRWKRALHQGKPFQNAETLDQMLMPFGDNQYGYAHGLGVNRRGFGADTLLSIGHGGHIEGFNSDDRYFPEREWTLIVLDNTNGNVGRIGNDLVRLLLGQQVSAPE
ncbi:MAG: serine hydrolase domain-containing protein [Rhodothermales bacterium]